ncbi:bifunctional 4-hydroxy-2-oxoglutarate aldolase/2-dehydro-3-deoxy-phosphogluconate aldolase [Microbacterium aquimaris]|uniref:bifunctional 4-hydroxy-2-oxoglutarate aldolase/2-dehydro-3-deoxy-phosphogluconate aldolase n=1 Tax=Microbacterium aquimaris TaxID=459816 RepID=UPI002AD228BD|nr:bifunctional 4-hydroxy-2-oxoglutarate aldolase/2-dehydro-3-deoxy-phosphogluconate aldolase [Microbacterium aquimaris]MDZ8275271.1 bifunctional 4-hydroxy-2-oxoglutarate aldolase/2-dehydro-3-deoxy-phosphogluconate aldolase [Microbacterium aquimaris]
MRDRGRVRMRRYEIASEISRVGVVAIIRTASADDAYRRCCALIDAGQTVLEVSLTTPGAVDVIHRLRGEVDADVIVGVGTVLDAASARTSALAGAQFIVSPTVDQSVLATSHRYGMASLPGAATPTEAVKALEAGADFVKLFPASSFGPGSVRDMLQALPQLALVPTGGVTRENAADYVAAGAVAVGMGSAVTEGDPTTWRDGIAELQRTIRQARGASA